MTETSADEGESYLPSPQEIMDGAVLLSDPLEFFELTESYAAIVRDGALFVLRRDTMKWVNVEALPKAGAKLSAIKSTKA